MSADKPTPIESLEIWLSRKPYWEQYVWDVNFEKESLTVEDIDLCYQYLSEYLGLIGSLPFEKPAISFKNDIIIPSEVSSKSAKIKILEVKNFKNINAISEDCSVKFGSNLTLIYGSNGSGKSGVGRLLCNACFSRGEREILPNVKNAAMTDLQAKAKFVLSEGAESLTEIDYYLGHNNDVLKCFSVFDSESVLIHLDQSNQVKFTPAHIKIFDKVANTISELEKRLINEKNMANLQKLIDEKKKLDITKKKSLLNIDRQNLLALKTSLRSVAERFTRIKTQEANMLISNIVEKQKVIEALSVRSFDDGILNTIGCSEWKALISTAKNLYNIQKIAEKGKEPEHCMLCHQKLSEDAKSLFQKYWKFLESEAEGELSRLMVRHTNLLQDLRSIKAMYPKFRDTDAGVKVLKDEAPNYLTQLKDQFVTLEDILDDWLSNINQLHKIIFEQSTAIDLSMIDNLIATKATEASNLVDPSSDIIKLTSMWNDLKHKKEVTAVKDSGLKYIAFLNWLSKANGLSFSGIKMAITKKRTESFLVGVAINYKGVFNRELIKIGCDFNLVMNTSGEQGNTVKGYRLDFAEDYNPSQVLSEGEQNVCAIADFLTEAQLDKNNCGIIFDDPVTSLDHERKDKIAQRIAVEARQRQVVVFTHDIVFMSQLVNHAERNDIPVVAHWMRKVNGIPGCVEENTSPKLALLANLRKNCQEAVTDFDSFGPKIQEQKLGVAFDYLRSCCEALIEERLFAGTIERYSDHVKVKNLEEVVFDQNLALKIVDLHGRLSEIILAHNRSDIQREKLPSIGDFNILWAEFEVLERSLKEGLSNARKDRDTRKKVHDTARVGW